METIANSSVKVVGGLVPYGWERKTFLSKEDNGSGILTIVKETPYRPTAEKLADMKARHPETFATIAAERFLTVNLNFGGSGQVRRTLMLSQYVRALKDAGLEVFDKDGETVRHGFKFTLTEGELNFINVAKIAVQPVAEPKK